MMPGEPPDISLGDVARAVTRLEPADAATDAAIVRMLGFELVPRRAGRRAVPAPAPQPRPPVAASPTEEQAPTDRPAKDLGELPLLLRIAPRAAPAEVPWAHAEALPPVDDNHLYGRLPYEPLFEPRWMRELLYAAIAAVVPGDELDVPAAVATLAAGEPLDDPPRLPRRSATFGAQLLVDGGAGMEPFRRDAAEVVRALRRIAGRAKVRTLHFEGTLRDGVGEAPTAPRIAYAPPESGTPVLMLSDLGLAPTGGGPDVDEWLELARRLARRGSRLVAFVPYPAQRWPARLAREVALVQWDRLTTVASLYS
jgi:hypothetical protein